MKKLFALAWFVFALAACGQTLSVYPTAVSAPAGSYQTITAIVTGVNNKAVTWTTSGGTLKGNTTCVVNEPCTIALYSATSGGPFTVTATANGFSATATSSVTFTASPTRASTHPRLYTTSGAVAALQAKVTGGNTNWVDLLTQGQAAFTHYNAAYSWGSGPTCGGTHTPTSVEDYSENGAYLFAYLALVDPSDASYNWKCYAHDIWVNVIHQYQIVDGGIPGGANEWSNSVPAFAYTPDLLLATSALSSGEITTTRAFMYWMLSNQVMPSGSGYVLPHPDSGYNSPTQWTPAGGDVIYSGPRDMGNNYSYTKMLYLVAYGLTFDDNNTDDPPTTNTCSATRHQVCADFTAGSLSAYFYTMYVKSWAYLTYAHLEDPTVSLAAYNDAYSIGTMPQCESTNLVSYPCLGDGRGGESSEGSSYSYSMYRMRLALNAIHNAGADDPITFGPQLSLGTSSWWDLKWMVDANFLLNFPAQTGRPQYAFLWTGDENTYYRQVLDMETEATMYLADSYSNYTGYSARRNAELWLLLNSAWGGPAGTGGGCTSNCGWHNNEQNGNISQYTAFEMFTALGTADPVVTSPPTDPRPSLPLDIYNGSYNQHQLVRNSITSNPTWFNFFAPNTFINHENQHAGRFDIYSNGEAITKSRNVFDDYNYFMDTSQYQNTIDVVNSVSSACTQSLVYDWYPSCNYGGQFWQGAESGRNTLLHSELPTYAADIDDLTNMYNGAAGLPYWSPYNDVTKAARSLVYLRGTNGVVIYDRTAVGHAASLQSVSTITTGAVTISGAQGSWLTRSGMQKAFLTSVLPAGGTVAVVKLPIDSYPTAPFSSLHLGNTMQAVCIADNADGSTSTVTAAPEVEWWTDSSAIATVSTTGLVTSVGTGTTNLYCKYQRMQGAGSITITSGSSSGSMTGAPSGDPQQKYDWEPYQALKVSPSGTPTSAQFLSVLEWGTSGFAPLRPTLVQSTAGQGFDAALVHDGATLVAFMRNWPATFTGTTYPASGASVHYVSDLTPNTTYSISGAGAPTTATTDNAGVMTFAATGTGNIVISTGGTPTAATPTFSPAAGSYSSAQSVTLSTSSVGAIKCYNFTGSPLTNGTTGCGAGSTLYTAAIPVSTTSTIFAVAGGTGYLDSPVGSATYTITFPAASTPTFAPGAGTYATPQSVAIFTSTSGATLCYTTDGSAPTANGAGTCTHGTTYFAVVPVASSLTLKAIASKSGNSDSAVASAAYVITPTTGTTTFTGTFIITSPNSIQ